MILKVPGSLGFILLLTACVLPVEIDTERRGDSVIISGQLSNLAGQSVVFVGITADIERLPYPVSNAVIDLYADDLLAGSYVEDQSNTGKYILQDYEGVPGKTYRIHVTLPDGRTYESLPEKMPEDSGEVDSYYEIVKDEEFIDYEGILVRQPVVKIYANGVLPAPKNRFIRWTVEEVFILFGGPSGPVTPPPCFVTQLADPQSIVLLDRQFLTATQYPHQLVAIRVVDYTFEFRHYFVTYQSALTREAFEYWRNVDILVSQSGSIFDTPPAVINGNISNTTDESERVFGYFEAAHQTLHRVLLTRDDFPFPLNFSSCNSSTGVPPRRCSDCLSVRNASHVRPPWF